MSRNSLDFLVASVLCLAISYPAAAENPRLPYFTKLGAIKLDESQGATGEHIENYQTAFLVPDYALSSITFLRSPKLVDGSQSVRVCFFLPDFAQKPAVELADVRNLRFQVVTNSTWLPNSWNSFVVPVTQGTSVFLGGALTFEFGKDAVGSNLSEKAENLKFAYSPLKFVAENDACGQPQPVVNLGLSYDHDQLLATNLFMFLTKDTYEAISIDIASRETLRTKGDLINPTGEFFEYEANGGLANLTLNLDKFPELLLLGSRPKFKRSALPTSMSIIFIPKR